ncbi:MAG: hypothetical protein HQL25_07705 [Candidatus Omnitrophica bacterium]|nr:hypothetical protein [Candidatus Omnitrophota bacterium]
MQIVDQILTSDELKLMAKKIFGNLIKAVVDVDRNLLAIDANLHADLEAFLLENGSEQKNLWGINLYPELSGDDFVEFDSMINLRPNQNNFSRSVDDIEIRKKILKIVSARIK